MDLFELVLAQQERTSELLDELCRQPRVTETILGGQLRRRQELMDDLRRTFLPEEAAKRRHLWPMVRAVLPDGDEVADTAGKQRHRIEHLMAKLRWFGDRDAEGNDVVDALVDTIREHLDFEAAQLRRLRHRRTDIEDVLGTAAARLVRRAWARPTRPHPDVPNSPSLAALALPILALVDRVADACAFRPTGS